MTAPKLRSRITTDGLDRTPHRAFMRGMGLDDAAMAKPFIGWCRCRDARLAGAHTVSRT